MLHRDLLCPLLCSAMSRLARVKENSPKFLGVMRSLLLNVVVFNSHDICGLISCFPNSGLFRPVDSWGVERRCFIFKIM